jgi:hypothetical protein
LAIFAFIGEQQRFRYFKRGLAGAGRANGRVINNPAVQAIRELVEFCEAGQLFKSSEPRRLAASDLIDCCRHRDGGLAQSPPASTAMRWRSH